MAMTQEYEDKLPLGNEYERFIEKKWPIFFDKNLHPYIGKDEQRKGENREGIEIKLDQIFRRTKRLYIETAEKSDENNERFIPSGIYRYDNTEFFLVGDRKDAYVFDVLVLRKLEQEKPLWMMPLSNLTSQGWGMELIYVSDYAVYHLDFENIDLETY